MPRSLASTRFLATNVPTNLYSNGVDGSGGNVLLIPNSPSLNPTSAVTLEILFKPSIAKAVALFDNSTTGTTDSYALYLNANGSLSWYSTIAGVSKNITTVDRPIIWNKHNLVHATYTGSIIQFFVNGQPVSGSLAASGSMGQNPGPLRIGSYYSGGLGLTLNGYIERVRVYNAPINLLDHQNRYYRNVTGPALQSALVLDLDAQTGVGSVWSDTSGNGNNATLGTASSWVRESSSKPRKAINKSQVFNGEFDYVPPFVAPTAISGNAIDGTATSGTTDAYGWWLLLGVTTFRAQFDTAIKATGNASMKIEAVDATGRGRLSSAPFETTTTPTLIAKYGIPVIAGFGYKVRSWLKTNNVPASSVRVGVQFFTITGANITSYPGPYQATTQDFTLSEHIGIAPVNAAYARVYAEQTVAGTIGQTWVNNLYLEPVSLELSNRALINGNLVRNGSFELVPSSIVPFTMTGATRALDGSATGSTIDKTYGWSAFSSGDGTNQVYFDSVEKNSGNYSLKLSVQAVGSYIETFVPSQANVGTYFGKFIPVTPNTSYTYSFYMKTNYVSGDSAAGASITFIQSKIDGTSASSQVVVGQTKITTPWTRYTGTITTGASTFYMQVDPRVYGHTGAATLIMDAWFDDISLNQTFTPGTSGSAATGSFTVSDWTFLGGRPATLSFTITNYTLMAGGNFSSMAAGITIQEGVDFNAVTSNAQTALNIATFINNNLGDPGENPASVVGATMTLTLPGGNNGFDFNWSGSGVSPASNTATGGIDLTKVLFNMSEGTFTSDPSITDPSAIQTGSSNTQAASNLANYINTYMAGMSAIAVGNVVNLTASTPGTAGNSITIGTVGREGGATSGGLTPSGATLSGGTAGSSPVGVYRSLA